jgi:hypothetical protein
MSIYETRWFSRWARKKWSRQFSASPGGARNQARFVRGESWRQLAEEADCPPRTGKSPGFRTIVATCNDDRCFFVYGFAKNERSDIDDEEEAALKALAKVLLQMSPAALARAEGAGEVTKVNDDDA